MTRIIYPLHLSKTCGRSPLSFSILVIMYSDNVRPLYFCTGLRSVSFSSCALGFLSKHKKKKLVHHLASLPFLRRFQIFHFSEGASCPSLCCLTGLTKCWLGLRLE